MKHIWILLAALFVASATAASAQPFLLTTAPRSQSITGGTATIRVAVTAQVGFSATVFLSVAAPTLPQATVVIDPRQISAPYTDTATITLTLTGRKEGGTHPIIVTAKNGPAVVYDTVMVTIPNRANWRVYDETNSPYRGGPIVLDRRRSTIWFTTHDSVMTFDGTTFTAIAPPIGAFPLKHNIDAYGRFWGIFTSGAGRVLARYDDTAWTVFDGSDSSHGPSHWEMDTAVYILTGQDSSLWLASGAVLARCDLRTGTWTHYTHKNSDFPAAYYTRMMVDPHGAIWLNGNNIGLVKFDQTYWTVYDRKNFPSGGSLNLNPIELDPQDHIWVTNGFTSFAMSYDGSATTATTEEVYRGLSSMKFDDDGVIWTTNSNLNRYQGNQWWTYTIDNSGLPTYANWVDVDDSGTVWVGTIGTAFATFDKSLDPGTLFSTSMANVKGTYGSASAASASIAPNPARERATLRLHLLRDEHLRISLADPLGRETRVVSDGQVSAGEHQFDLDLTGLEPGLHFVRIAGDQTRLTRPVVVVR